MKAQGQEVIFAGEEEIVTVHEGLTIHTDILISNIQFEEGQSFTLTGGNPSYLTQKDQLKQLLIKLRNHQKLIGAICGGINILSELLDIEFEKLHSQEVTRMDNFLVSPPNKYVDFAIEMLNELDLYKDKNDYLETIHFFKEFKA